MADSIDELGLINPITIDKNNNLIAGAHRIEAHKLLGLSEIEAVVLNLDGLKAELAEIDENLIRNELHYIERGEYFNRRKAIYEELYPETKATKFGGAFKGNQYTEVDETISLTFAKDTANKIGVSTRTVEQEIQIANSLTKDAKDAIVKLDITKRDALLLAREDASTQNQVIDSIKENNDLTVPEALNLLNQPPSLQNEIPHVAHNSGNNEWYTPKEYIDAAREVMGNIDLDPASSVLANEIIKVDKYYTIDNNGLNHEWKGKVWLNPPYAGELIPLFIDKLKFHVLNGDIEEAIVLVNNATETNWFKALVTLSSAIIFPTSRIKFHMPDGTTGSPLQGQALVYIGKNTEKFFNVFRKFGWRALICAA